MSTTINKPKLKTGDPITPDTFNDIYDTIEEETNKINNKCDEVFNKLDNKYDETIYCLRLEIMNLQDEQTRNIKYTMVLQGVVLLLCVFILVLFLCIILGVF